MGDLVTNQHRRLGQLPVITHFLFSGIKNFSHDPVHKEIKKTGDKERSGGKEAVSLISRDPEKLGDAKHCDQSTVFDEGNHFIADGGQNPLDYLG